MQRIHTLLEKEQYDQLKKMSYKGKKQDKKPKDLTFSEHFREAIEEYLRREGK